MSVSGFEGVKRFLAEKALSQLLQSQNQHVVSLKTTSTVESALKSMSGSNVLSEPVVDEQGEYYGCLSVNDVLKSLVHGLEAKYPKFVENVDSLTKQSLESFGLEFSSQQVGKLQHHGVLCLLDAAESSSLLDLVLEGLSIRDSHVHHRVYVCTNAHPQKSSTEAKITVVNIAPGSELDSATGLAVTHVVSQSDIVHLLWENKAVFGDALKATVQQLGLATGVAITVPADTPTLAAFSFMATDHKSAVGVTSPASGALVGNLSASDLRGLAEDEFPFLLLPVSEFLLVRRGLGVSKDEALEGKRVENAEQALVQQLPIVTVQPGDSLERVLELLATKGLHRVYVTDSGEAGQGKPLSVITLTDVLRLVTK